MNLFIVTHWAKERSPSWEWRAFVVAAEPWDALRAAVARNAWQVDGQLHVSQVSDGEFVLAEAQT